MSHRCLCILRYCRNHVFQRCIRPHLEGLMSRLMSGLNSCSLESRFEVFCSRSVNQSCFGGTTLIHGLELNILIQYIIFTTSTQFPSNGIGGPFSNSYNCSMTSRRVKFWSIFHEIYLMTFLYPNVSPPT